MMPNLSVVIPTFRRTDSLRRLLEALLIQKEVRLEIIVVDQNPPGYLADVLPQSPAIKHLLRPSPNCSDARNSGFLVSTGEIILFIDDDLLPEADFCRKALDVLQKYPTIGCFSPLVHNAEGPDIALKQAQNKLIRKLDASSGIFTMTDTISACLFFRRPYFEKTGGFDPLLFEYAQAAEDQELFMRMRKKALDLYFVPSVPVFHDENTPGGCDLRTDSYWKTREKCMKAWAFRHRIHHQPPGVLSAGDFLQLARSAFLNREVLSSGMRNIRRQLNMLRASIKSSGKFLDARPGYYSATEQINHLSKNK